MGKYEYKVIPFGEIVESASWLSLASTKMKEIAESFTDGLNKKDAEGWELVSTYATAGNGLAIFKRPQNNL